MEKRGEVARAEGSGVSGDCKHVITTIQCDALFFNYKPVMSVTNLENKTDAFSFVFTMIFSLMIYILYTVDSDDDL